MMSNKDINVPTTTKTTVDTQQTLKKLLAYAKKIKSLTKR